MKITSSKAKKVLKLMSVMATMTAMFALFTIVASAGAGDPSTPAGTDANAAYHTVMDFVIVWIRRAGAAVGLIGAVMFMLGLKDDGDSSRKTAGLWTMIAGFGVAAVALAADMFHLFE